MKEFFRQLPAGARVIIKHRSLGHEVEVRGTFGGALNMPQGGIPSVFPSEHREVRILVRHPLTNDLIDAPPLRTITSFYAPDYQLMDASRLMELLAEARSAGPPDTDKTDEQKKGDTGKPT